LKSAARLKDSAVLREARRVLVMKLRYIGDSIWMLPLVDNLKKNMPGTMISVLVNKGTEAFFYDCPSVDNVVTFPRDDIKGNPVKFFSFLRRLRKLNPDVVIELTDADRPALISFFSGAKTRIGYNNEDRWRKWLYTHTVKAKMNEKHYVDYHLDVLREIGLNIYDDSIKINIGREVFDGLREKMPSVFHDDGRKKVVLHPGSRNALRQWGADNFAFLCDALSPVSRVFLVAGPKEGPILDEVMSRMKGRPEVCTNDIDILEFAALCELSHMFIGNDSAPMHIASSKTFTVGIFGPTLPELVGPWTERKLVFFDSRSLECRTCKQVECTGPEFNACLRRIKPADVAEKVMGVLKGL
jgi:ADP-heptose:LPS heptosyltransferase